MRIIHVEEDPEYGVALGSILVSLLEPSPGTARDFNRWYERDHFYAGCMSGANFFAGRRFVATRPLKDLRYPASSNAVADTSIGSFLALYWMERGRHRETEDWAVERVLQLGEEGRMAGGADRKAVHASFYVHRWSARRDDDGIPAEVALDHPFAGVVMVISERPEGVTAEAREKWFLEEHLPKTLPGSNAALCLSLDPLQLPEESPAYVAPVPGSERRGLELYFLDRDPREGWDALFGDFARTHAEAGMGEIAFAAGFLPTLPGTDRYVDEL
ncbi:MAG: hypothetical protein GY910_20545 [bacterium]|nr:hypothetical protein [Deltaproteobacteria bacterium]MCP4907374.1 hypothetical protein [bacterium]